MGLSDIHDRQFMAASRYIEIHPTWGQIDRAQRLVDLMGIPPNSVTNGEKREYGCLGEIVVSDYFGWEHIAYKSDTNTIDYDADLLTKKGNRVDVKTKDRHVRPEAYHMEGVFKYAEKDNMDQDVLMFVMCNCLHDFSRIWILGYIGKYDILKPENVWLKGQPEGNNGFITPADCWQVKHDKLEPLPKKGPIWDGK